jgi:peptide/nickel transport system ATP-binding protein
VRKPDGRVTGQTGDPAPTLLEVRNLKTHFFTSEGIGRAVDGISFSLAHKGRLGIVGESGCGKSVTALSIMKLLPRPGRITSGEVIFEGEELVGKPEREMRRIRGSQISMIFQEPMTSLNPVHSVGTQIVEAITYHRKLSVQSAREIAIEMLDMVGIPSPRTRLDDYPHQLSGGMRQRVMIAMALSCRPKLLIADEPTTALDVTIQAQILDLMNRLRADLGTAVILITHDMGVIAEMVDTVAVMYAGKLVEKADVRSLFAAPKHPYTWGLLASMPKLNEKRERLRVIEGSVPSSTDPLAGCRFCTRCEWAREICWTKEPPLLKLGPEHEAACWVHTNYAEETTPRGGSGSESIDWASHARAQLKGLAPRSNATPSSVERRDTPLLEVKNLTKYFPSMRGQIWSRRAPVVKAVDGVSFSIDRGETLGLVGESGCGKTSVGWLILRLIEPTDGKVIFDDQDIFAQGREGMRKLRRNMQIIFQDPYSSLNPRLTVRDIITQPLTIHHLGTRAANAARTSELLNVVGLNPDISRRYPHELSGGQRQRVGVARALALNPKLVICDEPVSALDVSIQAQIINLLQDLQRELALTYVFIAHDLSVVKHISTKVGVMYLGKMAELASKDDLFDEPLHPYTKALLSAIPVPDPNARRERQILTGDIPSPINPPSGCRFHTRCPIAAAICRVEEPAYREIRKGHWVACHMVTA